MVSVILGVCVRGLLKNKAKIKQALLKASGLSAYKWSMRPAGLYCFNYHRIGDATASEFDPDLYSCDAQTFAQHVAFFKTQFELVSLVDVQNLLAQGKPLTERYALLTFDDGYLDNYQLAYPILRDARASAVFFIAVDYARCQHLPWWDEIAWMVRHCTNSQLKLAHWQAPLQLDRSDIVATVRAVVKACKVNDGVSMDEKVAALRSLTGLDCQRNPPEQLFANEQQISEMADQGMFIGSHSCSHRILSHLSLDEQRQEIVESKRVLEAMTGQAVHAFAYPVGGRTAFDQQTQTEVERAGYQLAFSFINGINRRLDTHRYRLRRLAVEDNMSPEQLKQLIAFSEAIV